MRIVFQVLIILAIIFSMFWLSSSDDPLYAGVFRVRDGEIISHEELIREIQENSVVFVGELHTDEDHHRLQLGIIKSLSSSAPAAVGFEMFTSRSQKALDEWTDGRLPVRDFEKIYYENWRLPWSLYKDILFYLRESRIPALGLNIPQEISRKVASYGFASITDEDLRQLPPGISCDVDETYMKFIRRAYSAHGKHEDGFLFFCEAQLLWDKAMAWNLLNFLGENPERTVVVLAGTGHAWKKGIPEQIQKMSKETTFTVILPEVPDYIEPETITFEDADYLLLYKKRGIFK